MKQRKNLEGGDHDAMKSNGGATNDSNTTYNDDQMDAQSEHNNAGDLVKDRTEMMPSFKNHA